MSVQQQISFFWIGQAKKLFPAAKVNGAVNAVGARSVELMRQRTMAGLDRNGRAFAPYTKRYARYKSAHLRFRGKYAARALDDHIRLTGDLFRNMYYTVTQAAQFKVGEIDGSVRLYIGADAARKAAGLQSTTGVSHGKSYSKAARLFFGVAEGNTAIARREKKDLKQTFVKAMGFKPSQFNEVGL